MEESKEMENKQNGTAALAERDGRSPVMRCSFHVLSSGCDAEGRLGVRNLFDVFMDLASEHAALLGVGYRDMREKGCYWVAVRTRARILRRPDMGEPVEAETWPGKPGLAKSERYYRLKSGKELLAEGRTEWAVQDMETGMIRRSDSYGWPDIDVSPERVCPEPFTRFRPLKEGDVSSYTVCSADIDTGRHMNNTAYVRMFLSVFSTAELAEMDIREAEIHYRTACREGETLTVRRVLQDGVWLMQAEKPGGEAAVSARFVC